MKTFKIKIFFFLGLLALSSCEEYLDIAPEAVLTEEEVFSTFNNVQGFIEEMNALVVNYGTQGWSFQDYLLGDDNYNTQSFKLSVRFDRGELDRWVNGNLSYLGRNTRRGSNQPIGDTSNNNGRNQPKVWNACLIGIRKANIVIQNEELMVGLSQEEKNVALGQAYFFRAFFHAEIMKFWGRFPHITEVLEGEITIQRPETYREVALSVNEDYKKAIELLPIDWDNEPYGQNTIGNNRVRITKGAAYALQGKNLLLAASPLMFFNNAPGIETYTYDTELAAMAAEAFAEVIKLADAGEYSLAQNMEDYKKVLWEAPNNSVPGILPEANEWIFGKPGVASFGERRSFMSTGLTRDISGTSTQCTSATHNFIHNNFGMANGLSIEDDLSGRFGPPTYNPNRPFDNRDPRLYEWVILDRDVLSSRATVQPRNRVMEFFVDDGNGNTGNHRKAENSLTGYMFKKFYPEIDGEYHVAIGNNIMVNFSGTLIHTRLTDVYLMYAEAVHVVNGATGSSNSISLTPEQVVNIMRTRAGLPNIRPEIVADNNDFMDELRRERSVELSYEAHRWTDLRRWGIAHEAKYRIKTELRFDKDWTFFEEKVLSERVCEYPKHYWLPFQVSQTQLYEGFPQNPGW